MAIVTTAPTKRMLSISNRNAAATTEVFKTYHLPGGTKDRRGPVNPESPCSAFRVRHPRVADLWVPIFGCLLCGCPVASAVGESNPPACSRSPRSKPGGLRHPMR